MSAGLATAQAFGRFGYVDQPQIPGFVVDREGFVAKFGASEKFYFGEAVPKWRIVSSTELEEKIGLGQSAGPNTLMVDLLAPGFMLQFSKGFALKLRATSAPFLSWKEGSVGEHVPTPGVRWIAVSFRQGQPPIVLGFMDGAVSLQVDGRIGDWTIRTAKPYSGWVRVALPYGTQPVATDSAATLGKLCVGIAASDEIWWQPAPRLADLVLKDEDSAVEATWLFDRKGAVVPVGAALANLGSYPLTIHSRTRRLPGFTEEGPTTVCEEESLRVRFPVRRIPLGRAITSGSSLMKPIGTVSAFDVRSVVELAFENLLAARDRISRATAESAVNELVQNGTYVLEPHTNQQLPFSADGTGLDVAAADSLLFQAFTRATSPSSQENSLLTSVTWRRDWYTWRIWAGDPRVSRRAGALIAVAGALCPEPGRRLDAGLAEAGLAAERGLGIFLARAAGRLEEPPYLEPLYTIRNTLFDMAYVGRLSSPFAVAMLGGVRVFGDPTIQCTGDAASGFLIDWGSGNSITLASRVPLVVSGDGVDARSILGYTVIRATAAGVHSATVKLPPWARSLPAFVAPPTYDEPVK